MHNQLWTQCRRGAITAAFWTAAVLWTTTSKVVAGGPTDRAAGLLFREAFDDARLPERGWYDGQTFAISRGGAHAGACIEYHWKTGATTPDRSQSLRRLFEPTDTVYVRFFIKLSPGWGWTGRSYHPHLMHFLTSENDRYHGPAASHLTLYIEPQEGKLRLAAQDIQNQNARVDQSRTELEKLVHIAGEAGCDVMALPEDTLGLLKWESANTGALDAVLPRAVPSMLERLGRAAATHRMYLVVCQETFEKDGRVYNTSFLLGRDGKEIGRYHKEQALPTGEKLAATVRASFPSLADVAGLVRVIKAYS